MVDHRPRLVVPGSGHHIGDFVTILHDAMNTPVKGSLHWTLGTGTKAFRAPSFIEPKKGIDEFHFSLPHIHQPQRPPGCLKDWVWVNTI